MTREELILIKELIREVVKSTVKEVLAEEYKNSNNKKDLKEIKLLLASSIKESRRIMENATFQEGKDESRLKRIREAVGEDFMKSISKSSADVAPVSKIRMSPEQAAQISTNGSLPDIDAPIPFINKNSVLWNELKEKTG